MTLPTWVEVAAEDLPQADGSAVALAAGGDRTALRWWQSLAAAGCLAQGYLRLLVGVAGSRVAGLRLALKLEGVPRYVGRREIVRATAAGAVARRAALALVVGLAV